MRHRTAWSGGVLMLALGLGGCDGSEPPSTPSSPSVFEQVVAPSPHASWLPGHVLTGVSLSGVVYELTATGRKPIAGAVVYCEPCGEETHSFAYADDNGFYHFPGDLATGGGVWVARGVPTPINVDYNTGFEDPPGAASRRGPGWREVIIDGDTRFDIELIRPAAAAP
jgi:hypothetical protein